MKKNSKLAYSNADFFVTIERRGDVHYIESSLQKVLTRREIEVVETCLLATCAAIHLSPTQFKHIIESIIDGLGNCS